MRDPAANQDQAYYLPPGAAPFAAQPMPIARPYVNETDRPRSRQTSGGRDYLSGRPTVPPPARGPTITTVGINPASRPESPYDPAQNDRLAPLSPLPLGLSPPMPITRKKPAAEAWSGPVADREPSPAKQPAPRSAADAQDNGPGGYVALPPMPIPKPSSRTRTPTQGSEDMRAPVFSRQRADSGPRERDARQRGNSDPGVEQAVYAPPRGPPPAPSPRTQDAPRDPRAPRDMLAGYQALPPPAVVLSNTSTPSLDLDPPESGMQSMSISPNGSSTQLHEEKKKDKGRFLNSLGLGKHKEERDRPKYKGGDQDQANRPSMDGSRDERVSRDAQYQQQMGGPEIPPKRERAKLEKAYAKREKEDRREAEIAAVEDTVGRAIGKRRCDQSFALNLTHRSPADICRRAEGSDVGEILLLCERVAHSPEAVAKDAARATRKELKHGSDEMAKVTAAKIWLLGCANSPEKGGFRSGSYLFYEGE